jgi:hypothetical protein
MSEEIWCNMYIEVPVHWWPNYSPDDELPTWLDDAHGAFTLCWEWEHSEHELLNDQATVRVIVQGCQNYGTSGLSDLRDWLAQRGIPYSIDQEGKDEWDGETIVFNGTGEELDATATNDGEASITLSTALVHSSSTANAGHWCSRRAIPMRCCSPTLRMLDQSCTESGSKRSRMYAS